MPTGAEDPRPGWDVFVSYSRVDSIHVHALVDRLRSEGLRVWVDVGDIRASVDWRAEIRAGIDESDAVLIVLSTASLASPECDAEWSYALERGKRLIPVSLDGVVGGVVRPDVAALQFIRADSDDTLAAEVAAALALVADDARLHTTLGLRARSWESNEDPSGLLRGADLQTAVDWLGREPADPRPTQSHRRFIDASQTAAAARRDKADLAASLVRELVADSDQVDPPGLAAPRAVRAGAVRRAVLLTDMVGSTALWQTHADVMPEVLQTHHALVAAAVSANGGVLPRDQGEGDARLAVFDAVASAVAAAVAIQRAFGSHDWPGGLTMRVRMGIHVGSVVTLDENVYGEVVNRCARIRGAAHGGQILVSGEAVNELRVAPVTDVDLLDVGTVRLRDVPEPVPLSQVVADGLIRQHPAPVGESATEVRLPAPATTFVGRAEEVHDLTRLVMGHRLVTLTGPGGAGKSRLGLAVAADAVETMPGGVRFADLSTAELGTQALREVSLAFDLDDGDDLVRGIALATGAKPSLLVLDEGEQVSGLDVALVDLLKAVPQLHLLVTSRAPLRVPDEHVHPVRPLTTPADDDSLEAVAGCDAVRLFVERAQAARPGFHLEESTVADVAAVVSRLDGHPLALELAAARLRTWDLATLRSRLSGSLADLRGARGTVTERQASLTLTLDWSVQACGSGARRLARALVRWPAGITPVDLDALAERVDADPLDDVADLLNLGLLHVLSTVEGSTRLGLLTPVRDHLESDMDADDRSESALALLDVLRARCDEAPAFECLVGPATAAEWRWCQTEWENLMAAVPSVPPSSVADLVRVAQSFARPVASHSHAAAVGLLEAVELRCRPGSAEWCEVRLARCGYLAEYLDGSAAPLFDDLMRHHSGAVPEAEAHAVRWLLAVSHADPDQRQHAESAMAAAKSFGPIGRGMALAVLGQAQSAAGDVEGAVNTFDALAEINAQRDHLGLTVMEMWARVAAASLFEGADIVLRDAASRLRAAAYAADARELLVISDMNEARELLDHDSEAARDRLLSAWGFVSTQSPSEWTEPVLVTAILVSPYDPEAALDLASRWDDVLIERDYFVGWSDIALRHRLGRPDLHELRAATRNAAPVDPEQVLDDALRLLRAGGK